MRAKFGRDPTAGSKKLPFKFISRYLYISTIDLFIVGKYIVRKRRWSIEEKAAVERQLNRFLQTMKVPGKRDCEEAVESEGALQNRCWESVKYYVHNCIQTKKRKLRM